MRQLTRSLRFVPSLFAALTLTATARADPPEPAPELAPAQLAAPTSLDQARALFIEGVELGRQARWDDALEHFQRAQALVSNAGTTYNIAQCERALGRYTRAHRAFRQALADNAARGGAEISPEQVAEAQRSLVEIEARLARITVEVSPPGTTVAVDGRPLEPAPPGGSGAFAGTRAAGPGEASPAPRFDLFVDPGPHVFVLGAPTSRETVVSATFAPGARQALRLERPSAEPPEPPKDSRSTDEMIILYTSAAVWSLHLGASVTHVTSGNGFETMLYSSIGALGLSVGTLALLDNLGARFRYGVPHSISAGVYLGLTAGTYVETLAGTVGGPMRVGFMTAGAVAGGILADRIGTTPGRASLVLSGGLWGSLLASLVAMGAALRNDAVNPTHVISATGLAGGTLGAIGGALAASRMSPPVSRMRYIDLTGLAGALVVGGIHAAALAAHGKDDADYRPVGYTTVAGGVAGLALGFFLTRDTPRDEPRRRHVASTGPVMPTFAPTPGGGTLGFAGSF